MSMLKLSVTLALLVAAHAAPQQRNHRSLEPTDYLPPQENHNQVQLKSAENEYLPPEQEQLPTASQDNDASSPQEKSNLDYLPPVEEMPVAIDIRQDELNLEPNDANNLNINAPMARQEDDDELTSTPLPSTEEVPASHQEEPCAGDQCGGGGTTQQQNEPTVSVRVDDGNSQAKAIGQGEQVAVTACDNSKCQEETNTPSEGYFYPKPVKAFHLPGRTIEEPLPVELPRNKRDTTQTTVTSSADGTIVTSATSTATANGRANAASTAVASDSGVAVSTSVSTGPRTRREVPRKSSLSTDPADGPVRITSIPFLLTQSRGQRAEIDFIERSKRNVNKQTKPAPKDQPRAQTLPGKIASAQTLPAKVRRDTKKSTYPSQQKNDQLKAQTLPAKIGTAQTLPGKI